MYRLVEGVATNPFARQHGWRHDNDNGNWFDWNLNRALNCRQNRYRSQSHYRRQSGRRPNEPASEDNSQTIVVSDPEHTSSTYETDVESDASSKVSPVPANSDYTSPTRTDLHSSGQQETDDNARLDHLRRDLTAELDSRSAISFIDSSSSDRSALSFTIKTTPMARDTIHPDRSSVDLTLPILSRWNSNQSIGVDWNLVLERERGRGRELLDKQQQHPITVSPLFVDEQRSSPPESVDKQQQQQQHPITRSPISVAEQRSASSESVDKQQQEQQQQQQQQQPITRSPIIVAEQRSPSPQSEPAPIAMTRPRRRRARSNDVRHPPWKAPAISSFSSRSHQRPQRRSTTMRTITAVPNLCHHIDKERSTRLNDNVDVEQVVIDDDQTEECSSLRVNPSAFKPITEVASSFLEPIMDSPEPEPINVVAPKADVENEELRCDGAIDLVMIPVTESGDHFRSSTIDLKDGLRMPMEDPDVDRHRSEARSVVPDADSVAARQGAQPTTEMRDGFRNRFDSADFGRSTFGIGRRFKQPPSHVDRIEQVQVSEYTRRYCHGAY